MQTFDTPDAIAFYRATAIASAAALYLNTGMRANRAYTPKAMTAALNQISGSKAKSLKPALRDYVLHADKAGHPVTSPKPM